MLSDTLREAAFHGQAVKTVAYLRVSTPQQDVSSQRLAILEYAQKHDLHIDDFIEATASGQASEKRRRLDELTSALQPGDRLIVSELSRLGRSLGQVVAVLDALAKAGVAFVALKENIRVEGKRDIQTKVTTTLFALFAEVERDLISERTREGLAKARASGRKLGRPKGSLPWTGREDRRLSAGVDRAAGRAQPAPRHPWIRPKARLPHRRLHRGDCSGQASEKRRRLDELTSLLERGDRLVVSELSRLGRALGQIVAILDALAKAGVAFVALKDNIRVEGRRDIRHTTVHDTLVRYTWT